MRIGVDPGHGGKDSGAIGPSGLKEKDVVLAVSLELEKLLKYNGFDTVITRKSDTFPELIDRSNLFNRTKCDLAISVHCNAATSPRADYIATFIQGRGGKAETLAIYVQRHLAQSTKWEDGGIRVANLHMTRETKMPAVLLELGFISNPAQEKWLRVTENQKKLAKAIAQGVCDSQGKAYKAHKEETRDQANSLVGMKIEADAKVVFNGKEIPAGISEGRTYVELRALVQLLNSLKIEYDHTTKTTTLSQKTW